MRSKRPPRSGQRQSGGTGDDEAGAVYSLKVRAGTRFNNAQAGFAMSALPDGAGGYETDFRIQADRFAIMQNVNSNPADADHPFVVVGGVTYIKKAKIRDGDIDSLKIAGEAVTVPVGWTNYPLVLRNESSYFKITPTESVTLKVPGRIHVFWTCDVVRKSGSAAQRVFMRLWHSPAGGTAYEAVLRWFDFNAFDVGGGNDTVIPFTFGFATPGVVQAGTHFFSVEYKTGDGTTTSGPVYIGNRSLMITGIQR